MRHESVEVKVSNGSEIKIFRYSLEPNENIEEFFMQIKAIHPNQEITIPATTKTAEVKVVTKLPIEFIPQQSDIWEKDEDYSPPPPKKSKKR